MPSWPLLIFEDLYFGKIGVSKQQFPAAGSILMAVASASGRQPPVPDALGGVSRNGWSNRVLGVDSRYYIMLYIYRDDIGNYLLYLTISVMILIDIIIIYYYRVMLVACSICHTISFNARSFWCLVGGEKPCRRCCVPPAQANLAWSLQIRFDSP